MRKKTSARKYEQQVLPVSDCPSIFFYIDMRGFHSHTDNYNDMVCIAVLIPPFKITLHSILRTQPIKCIHIII